MNTEYNFIGSEQRSPTQQELKDLRQRLGQIKSRVGTTEVKSNWLFQKTIIESDAIKNLEFQELKTLDEALKWGNWGKQHPAEFTDIIQSIHEICRHSINKLEAAHYVPVVSQKLNHLLHHLRVNEKLTFKPTVTVKGQNRTPFQEVCLAYDELSVWKLIDDATEKEINDPCKGVEGAFSAMCQKGSSEIIQAMLDKGGTFERWDLKALATRGIYRLKDCQDITVFQRARGLALSPTYNKRWDDESQGILSLIAEKVLKNEDWEWVMGPGLSAGEKSKWVVNLLPDSLDDDALRGVQAKGWKPFWQYVARDTDVLVQLVNSQKFETLEFLDRFPWKIDERLLREYLKWIQSEPDLSLIDPNSPNVKWKLQVQKIISWEGHVDEQAIKAYLKLIRERYLKLAGGRDSFIVKAFELGLDDVVDVLLKDVIDAGHLTQEALNRALWAAMAFSCQALVERMIQAGGVWDARCVEELPIPGGDDSSQLLNVKDKEGRTPFVSAIEAEADRVVESYLAKGAKWNRRALEALLDSPRDDIVKDTNALWPIVLKELDDENILKFWRRFGDPKDLSVFHDISDEDLRKPEGGSETTLRISLAWFSAEKGDLVLFKKLCDVGFDPDFKNSSGKSPVDRLLGRGHKDMILYLLGERNYDAQKLFETSLERVSFLTLIQLIERGAVWTEELVRELSADAMSLGAQLFEGWDPLQDKNGNTLLSMAYNTQNHELAKKILCHGRWDERAIDEMRKVAPADVNREDRDHNTPLMFAITQSQPRRVKAVIDAGAVWTTEAIGKMLQNPRALYNLADVRGKTPLLSLLDSVNSDAERIPTEEEMQNIGRINFLLRLGIQKDHLGPMLLAKAESGSVFQRLYKEKTHDLKRSQLHFDYVGGQSTTRLIGDKNLEDKLPIILMILLLNSKRSQTAKNMELYEGIIQEIVDRASINRLQELIREQIKDEYRQTKVMPDLHLIRRLMKDGEFYALTEPLVTTWIAKLKRRFENYGLANMVQYMSNRLPKDDHGAAGEAIKLFFRAAAPLLARGFDEAPDDMLRQWSECESISSQENSCYSQMRSRVKHELVHSLTLKARKEGYENVKHQLFSDGKADDLWQAMCSFYLKSDCIEPNTARYCYQEIPQNDRRKLIEDAPFLAKKLAEFYGSLVKDSLLKGLSQAFKTTEEQVSEELQKDVKRFLLSRVNYKELKEDDKDIYFSTLLDQGKITLPLDHIKEAWRVLPKYPTVLMDEQGLNASVEALRLNTVEQFSTLLPPEQRQAFPQAMNAVFEVSDEVDSVAKFVRGIEQIVRFARGEGLTLYRGDQAVRNDGNFMHQLKVLIAAFVRELNDPRIPVDKKAEALRMLAAGGFHCSGGHIYGVVTALNHLTLHKALAAGVFPVKRIKTHLMLEAIRFHCVEQVAFVHAGRRDKVHTQFNLIKALGEHCGIRLLEVLKNYDDPFARYGRRFTKDRAEQLFNEAYNPRSVIEYLQAYAADIELDGHLASHLPKRLQGENPDEAGVEYAMEARDVKGTYRIGYLIEAALEMGALAIDGEVYGAPNGQ